MNLADILIEIEENDNVTERCISYCEVIIYLKALKVSYYFVEHPTAWKNEINRQVVNDMHSNIDKQIEEIKRLIDSSVK